MANYPKYNDILGTGCCHSSITPWEQIELDRDAFRSIPIRQYRDWRRVHDNPTYGLSESDISEEEPEPLPLPIARRRRGRRRN